MAILAKIKDFTNIKIAVLPRKLNHNEFHIVWIDKKNGTMSHFVHIDDNKNDILYSGKIKTVSLVVFEKFILTGCLIHSVPNKKMLNIAKKLCLPFGTDKKFIDWNNLDSTKPNYNENKVYFKFSPYIKVRYNKDNDSIALVKVQKNKDIDIPNCSGCTVEWKYILPYDKSYRTTNATVILAKTNELY